MAPATKPPKALGWVVCTDAAGNQLSRQAYYNETHAEALERDCKRRGGNPRREQPTTAEGASAPE